MAAKVQKAHLLFVVLLVVLGGLQYRLWNGDGGIITHNQQLEEAIAQQKRENEQLLERNRLLEAEVAELKRGSETVEERARHELGMIKDGETLYLLNQ